MCNIFFLFIIIISAHSRKQCPCTKEKGDIVFLWGGQLFKTAAVEYLSAVKAGHLGTGNKKETIPEKRKIEKLLQTGLLYDIFLGKLVQISEDTYYALCLTDRPF